MTLTRVAYETGLGNYALHKENIMSELNLVAMAKTLGVDSAKVQPQQCGVTGCVHDMPRGKEWLIIQEHMHRGTLTACSRRKKFLESRIDTAIESLISWMEKNTQLDVEKWAARVVTEHFCPQGDVGAVTVDEIRESQGNRFELQAALLEEEADHMRRLAYKADTAGRSLEDRLDYASKRLSAVEEEIRLCEKIQDFLDQLAEGTDRKLAFKAKARLEQLWKSNKLSWGSFVIMANQVHEQLGWRQIQPKKPIKDITEVASYWETKIEDLHAKAIEDEGRVLETSFDRLENDTMTTWDD